jgi:hypothetical protein
MNAKPIVTLFGGLLVLALGSFAPAADTKGAKVTFADQVSPIFHNRCGTCHNPDKAKGGLNLETFSTAMQGGGSGKVIEPGDPDGSTLLQLVMHKDQPNMPPKSPKIPDAEIDVIKKWIEGGALDTSGSVAATKAKAKFEFKLAPSSLGKPQGPPAMPENLVTEPVIVSPRAPAVVALAASPWAPLVAIGGHKQVLLYRTTDNHLVGVLPFPEGTVYALRFSRNGALVLAGGGRGGQSGLAVVWDVKTGKRAFEIGKEYDVVLAADISPDHGQVALGGPGKVVRVYNTADGQLQFELKKHTEWITALEFSPDGALLASGDRNNGLLVWEAQTGREFHDLRGHNGAITDIDWRLDSNVVASASEDGTVKLWEMENGNAIKSIGAHGGGVESVRFAKDGRLVTTGRDRVARLWDPNGGKLRDFEPFGDLALEAVFTGDDTRIVAGDWTGEVRVYDAKDGKRLANLAANPAALATRLEQARKAVASAQAAADPAIKAFERLQAVAAETAARVVTATKRGNDATTAAAQVKVAADTLDQTLQVKSAAETAALAVLKGAQETAAQLIAARAAAEKAVPEKAAGVKAAVEALAAAKAAVAQALARKAEQDKALAAAGDGLKAATTKEASEKASRALAQQVLKATELTAAVGLAGAQQSAAQSRSEQVAAEQAAAPALLVAATDRAKAAEAAAQMAQVRVGKLTDEKVAAAKAVSVARAVQKAVETTAAARKADLDQAVAARAAAEKAVAVRKAATDAALAALKAAQLEADGLAAEKKTADASKSAQAPKPPKG